MDERLGWLDRVIFRVLGINPSKNRLGYLRTLIVVWWVFSGSVAMIFVCLSGIENVATALLGAAAASMLMSGVGFLFAIPKTSQLGAPPRTALQGEKAEPLSDANSEGKENRLRHFVNTNLEDISDWLTKIIIGLALIEWQHLFAAYDRAARLLADALSSSPENARNLAIAHGILVCFGVGGFLFGYLFTRLFLSEAMTLADSQTVVARLDAEMQEVKATVGALQQKVVESRPDPARK